MAKISPKAFTCRWYGQKALVAIEGPKGSKTEGKFAIHCKCVACQRRRLGYASAAEIEAMVVANPTMQVTRNRDTDDAWNALFEIVPEPPVSERVPRGSEGGPVNGSSPVAASQEIAGPGPSTAPGDTFFLDGPDLTVLPTTNQP